MFNFILIIALCLEILFYFFKRKEFTNDFKDFYCERNKKKRLLVIILFCIIFIIYKWISVCLKLRNIDIYSILMIMGIEVSNIYGVIEKVGFLVYLLYIGFQTLKTLLFIVYILILRYIVCNIQYLKFKSVFMKKRIKFTIFLLILMGFLTVIFTF